MSRSLVLLPTFNEAENITRILPRLNALEADLDIIIIDDASPDGTGVLADELTKTFSRLGVLHRRVKEGLGRAYVFGMEEAIRRGYNRIVTMDADLSHAPEDVPRLLAALDDAEVAIGSRHAPGGGVEGWPLPRRLLSRMGSLYTRALLGIEARDVTSGFRAYRAESLKAIDLDSIRSRGFAFQVELLRRILDLPGARAREVPIRFLNRRLGRSKLTLGIIAEAALEVLRLRFRKPPVSRKAQSASDTPHERSARTPSVSVIIPIKPAAPDPQSLKALESMAGSQSRLEVIVARGECPARQRNEAVDKSTGDLLLFLDDDSEPASDLMETYLELFRRDARLAAAGGPAVYRAGGFRERLSAALLTEPLVTGRSAARFSPRGPSRKSDERELILCNLMVRRSAFKAAGGFSERLYPNEENLLLERLRRLGKKILYEPVAIVRRPAPRAGGELYLKVFGYGQGRAAQARQSLSLISAARIAAAGVVFGSLLVAVLLLPSTAAPLEALGLGLILYAAVLSIRLSLRHGPWLGLSAPPVAMGLLFAYGMGILWGFCFRRKAGGCAVFVEKRNVKGSITVERLEFEHANGYTMKGDL
jgi:dolichol-phosphate mannosyltransferase